MSIQGRIRQVISSFFAACGCMRGPDVNYHCGVWGKVLRWHWICISTYVPDTTDVNIVVVIHLVSYLGDMALTQLLLWINMSDVNLAGIKNWASCGHFETFWRVGGAKRRPRLVIVESTTLHLTPLSPRFRAHCLPLDERPSAWTNCMYLLGT